MVEAVADGCLFGLKGSHTAFLALLGLCQDFDFASGVPHAAHAAHAADATTVAVAASLVVSRGLRLFHVRAPSSSASLAHSLVTSLCVISCFAPRGRPCPAVGAPSSPFLSRRCVATNSSGAVGAPTSWPLDASLWTNHVYTCRSRGGQCRLLLPRHLDRLVPVRGGPRVLHSAARCTWR